MCEKEGRKTVKILSGRDAHLKPLNEVTLSREKIFQSGGSQGLHMLRVLTD